MQKQQFSGKTLDAALDEAAKFFSTDKVFVRYNILDSHSGMGGFLAKLFLRSIHIEAWVETSREDLQAAAREVVRQALHKKNDPPQRHIRPAKEISSPQTALNMNDKEVRKIFEDFKNIFLSAINIHEKDVNVTVKENEAIITISNQTIENFLSKSDKLSLSFEHILKRMIQKKCGDISARIFIHAGQSSEKREEHLADMARKLAEKVRKTGKSIVLSSKSNMERKIIHLALEKTTGVATRSIGSGDRRKLVIYSLEKKNSSPRRQQRQR